MKAVMYFIGLLTTISITIGWLFKYLGWKGGGGLFTYGMIGFLLLFLPMLAFSRYKVALHETLPEKLKFFLGFGSAVILGIGILMRISGLPGAVMTVIAGTLLFSFGFLPLLFLGMYKKL